MVVKVTMMGVPVAIEDWSKESSTLDAHFRAVTLSPEALDRASQIVPIDVWKKDGLHTWLQQRSNAAFKRLKVDAKEIDEGRLKFQFDFHNDEPVLRMLVLLPPK